MQAAFNAEGTTGWCISKVSGTAHKACAVYMPCLPNILEHCLA